MGGLFSFLGADAAPTELPSIYPMPIRDTDFVNIDVQNIYSRILTDVLERTDGVEDKFQNLLWDNCLGSESQDGLVSFLAKAMVNKADLFLVYDKAVNVVRLATSEEQRIMRADYVKKNESKLGVYITFKNLKKTDMLRFYSALEYCTVGGLYKSMNLSTAIQVKISELRSSVSLSDSSKAKAQALAIANGLKLGKDVLTDAKDIIENAKPDLTSTDSALKLIANKQSFYLGLPISWITGETQKGLGDSGKADSQAIDRGLKPYYFSIIKPVLDTLFNIKTTYISEDFDGVAVANETLKTFELTSNELISHENKLKIINKIYGLPDDSEGDEPELPELPAPGNIPAQNPNPNVPPPENK